MKVISANLNGVRSAAKKGFFAWLDKIQADVICIQETKAQIHQLSDPIFHPKNYHCQYVDAVKKGYSGVAIYAKECPITVIDKLGWQSSDYEGRYLQFDFDNLSVASLYLPSGSSSEERQEVKIDFLNRLEKHLKKLSKQKRDFILCGDWNIAHTKKDIKNWRGNQKNSGFLPEERQWLDKVFGSMKYVDAFRVLNQEEDQYTWWSNRGQAWAKNVGWRIDYQIITPNLRDKVVGVDIYKDERFSDHSPLIIEYNI